MTATHMLLKPRVMDPRRRDDISEVLADLTKVGELRKVPAYMVNHYPEGLRDVTLGPHSRKLVGVSRYYPTLRPPVVVDFEPAPPDKWYFEEKIRFFAARGVLYVGIGLVERLTDEQFAAKYRDAKMQLDRSDADRVEADRLAKIPKVEDVLQDAQLQAALDARALWDVDQDIAARVAAKRARGERYRPPVGATRLDMAKRRKAVLMNDVRKKIKVTTDGSLDIGSCCHELTDPIERRLDGQIRPSEPGGSAA